ncbi:MAG: hypothetical protein JJU29_12825 [Verrucomicrobia bacterium]|nr:hypothetical protein [Verrucomicrobiota bacterium]MCH8513349.1 hypothetical protein [Kiritimatiellia bacterium]
MAENDFELDVGPKPKAKPQVSAWMLVVAILAFCGFAAVITLQAMEYMYMRGQLPNDADPYSTQVILPETP